MARRITGIGAASLKYTPIMAVGLAIFQYYQKAGGISGFVYDLKNLNMDVLQAEWKKIAMAMALYTGADTLVARFVPGKARYVVKAIMYYFATTQMLDVLNAMYSPAVVTNGGSAAAIGARGY